jgi:hypothetical protein
MHELKDDSPCPDIERRCLSKAELPVLEQEDCVFSDNPDSKQVEVISVSRKRWPFAQLSNPRRRVDHEQRSRT